MIIAEITINGTVNYIGDEPASLERWYAPYISSFTAPQYNTAQKYGGYVSLTFGDIDLNPDLFSSDWPPPKQCAITIKHTETTAAAAITLFSGYIYLDSFNRTGVQYSIFDTLYTKRLLSEGPDYDGNTVPYPKAFGAVTHVNPLRLADDGSSQPTYHLGGLATGTDAVALSSFSYSAAGKTKVVTTSAHGWSNSTSISISGTINFNGTYTIESASGSTFVINKAFPTDNSEVLPLHGNAFVAGSFAVYDDGVPIQDNVIINGDGTFSLSASPVGQVTISGTASQTTLEEVITWGQTQLGIGSIVTTNARASSPEVSCWLTSQQPTIDFMSSICAFFTHYFYIQNDVLTLGDMLLDNGTSTVDEFNFFEESTYGAAEIYSQIKSTWVTRTAESGFVDEVRTSRYIKDTTNYIVESLYNLAAGTATSTSASLLVDSGATFSTDGVKVGMTVQNTTDDTYALVTVVAETQLTLDSDIFVSGETYVVGPSMPYANELSVTPYHDASSNISTALQNILSIMNKDTGSVKLPIASGFPVPGERITFPDTSLVVDTSTYIRARGLSFNFDSHEIIVSGEGVIS